MGLRPSVAATGSDLGARAARDPSRTPALLGAAERITVGETVRACTVGPAHAAREEHAKGTLVPGMLADFTFQAVRDALVPVAKGPVRTGPPTGSAD